MLSKGVRVLLFTASVLFMSNMFLIACLLVREGVAPFAALPYGGYFMLYDVVISTHTVRSYVTVY